MVLKNTSIDSIPCRTDTFTS